MSDDCYVGSTVCLVIIIFLIDYQVLYMKKLGIIWGLS